MRDKRRGRGLSRVRARNHFGGELELGYVRIWEVADLRLKN